MIQHEQNSAAAPVFSIVIPVYNDWTALDEGLQSLVQQEDAPGFEVIIVDDGSAEPAPEFIRRFVRRYPLTVLQQTHKGIPVARNLGIQATKGTVLLFVDADCRLQPSCLAALYSIIAVSPEDDHFQLRLVGDCSTLVGRAEELRLLTFQNHMWQPDGRIRYLNTAGFAIRRAKASEETVVFDPGALRGEDTLLLADLMQVGKLPRFVPDAVVEHAVRLSLIECFRKDLRSVALEQRAYGMIAARGVRIRITHRERLRLLVSMWKNAGRASIGRSAWLVLVVRQTLRRIGSIGYQFLRVG